MKKVAVIMGSDSDLPVVQKTIDTLKDFNVPYEVHVYSAHRTPVQTQEFTANASDNGFGVIIAAAGKAAHLAGAIAANTILLDSLLSTVQMPSGMPVATVAIDGAQNAALLAIQMLAISDEQLAEKYAQYRSEATKNVLAKNKEIEQKFNG